MSKIKKLNELFDTADHYANNEIPYLTGELKDEITKSIQRGEIENFKDAPKMMKALRRLTFNFPFLDNSIARHISLESIIFVFANVKNLDNAFFIKIDLVEDLYNIAYGEAIAGVEHSNDINGIDYQELSGIIEKTIYPKFIEVVKYIKDTKDIDILGIDPKIANFSPMFNSKIYTFNQYVNELIEHEISHEEKIEYILLRKDDITWPSNNDSDEEEILKNMDKDELDDWYNNLKEFESKSHK